MVIMREEFSATAEGVAWGSDTITEFCSLSSLITELEPQANLVFFSLDLIGPLFQTFVDKGIKKSVECCIHHIQINTLHYHKDKEHSCNIFSKLLIEQSMGGGGSENGNHHAQMLFFTLSECVLLVIHSSH